MTELFLLVFLIVLMILGLRRPFLWIGAYMYIDIVAPQKLGYTILPSIPLSLIAFVAAFGGWLFLQDKQGARFTARQGLIVLLLLYCLMTTWTADFPEAAWAKWAWVWKALVFAAFLPLALTTRLRFETAILFYLLALGTIVINGGIKTVVGGGGYGVLRLLVDDNTGLYEGSIISTAAVAAIPLVWWLANYGTIFPRDWRVKLFAASYTFAAALIPIGTTARTGLVCLAVLGLMIFVQMKRRFLYAAMMGAAVVIAVPFLPSSYTERMSTIGNYQSDESASTRVEVWGWTLSYAIDNPKGGGFDAFLGNSFTFDTIKVEESGANRTITTQEVTEESRAYHSSYFEMLGEQGWIGLGIFLLLHALGLVQMQKLKRRWKRHTDTRDGWIAPLAMALQQAQIVYLVGAAFVGIAYQPFALIIVGLQIALWTYGNRMGTAEAPRRTALRPSEQLAAGQAATPQARLGSA